MRILRVHHITLAVRDLDKARRTFEMLFGGTAGDALPVRAFGVRTSDVPAGEDVLQLAAPLELDTALMRFIERRGEGVYNVALEVDDLDAAVAELASRGVRVSEPVEATPGLRSAFISMSATHGMSVQLVQPSTPTHAPAAASPEPGAAALTEHPREEMSPAIEAAMDAGEDLAPAASPADEDLAPDASPAGEETAAAPEPPPRRALDLTPDEWDLEDWSDTD